jgi:exopolyphosphatase/guanosine-5'-triphosphate,3'-diphosphate pyrophosphatase
MSMIYEAAVRGRDIFSSGHRTLPRKGLKKVNALLRKTTLKEKLRLPGLDPKRRDIAVPGGILLAEIMKRSGAEEILTGERGLREGILLDHLSRRRQGTLAPIARDVREQRRAHGAAHERRADARAARGRARGPDPEARIVFTR